MSPNPYDLKTFTNLSTYFEGERWTFWWPSALVPKADGSSFTMIQPVTDADKTTIFSNIREMIKTPEEKSIPSTF